MRRTTLAVIAATAVLSLTACDPAATSTAKSTTAVPTTAPPASATPAAPAATQPKEGNLPNFVGMGLQSAQDASQAAGFHLLTSHDALGRNRSQIDDRNWKVCTQAPAPGLQTTDAKVDLGAVKLDETCPAADQGAGTPTKASGTMPDFKGKAVSVASQTLDKATSFDIKDASGQGRVVIVQSNWQVCSQDPVAGTPLTGQPVSLKAVKFGESCP